MKKKSLAALILAVLLLLAACSPAVIDANAHGAITYPGVEWLATPEEVIAIMGKNADAFDITEKESGETRTVQYTTRAFLFGENANVTLTFTPSYEGETLLLHGVSAEFDRTDQATRNSLQKALEQEIARQGVAVDTQELHRRLFLDEDGKVTSEIVSEEFDLLADGSHGYSYSYTATSAAYTDSLPEEIQKEAYDFAVEYGAIRDKPYGTGPTYGEIIHQPLSVTGLTYEETAEGEAALRITFHAAGYCTMLKAALSFP